MSARSEATPTRIVNPSTFAFAIDKLVKDLEAQKNQFSNCILQGCFYTPTNPSTQGAGVGNTDWNVNHTLIAGVVDGVFGIVEAAADYNVHTGSLYTGLVATYSAIAAAVLLNTAGVISLAIVPGTAALTASVVAPTDAEIQASVGAGLAWVKIAELQLNRTGDAVVTQSQDNGKRPIPGVTVDTDFGDWSDVADG